MAVLTRKALFVNAESAIGPSGAGAGDGVGVGAGTDGLGAIPSGLGGEATGEVLGDFVGDETVGGVAGAGVGSVTITGGEATGTGDGGSAVGVIMGEGDSTGGRSMMGAGAGA